MKKYVPYILLSVMLVTSIVFNVFFAVKTFSRTDEKIFKDSINSVVEIKASTQDVGESFGTAEFIKSDGTLVTNAHVVTYKKMGVYYSFENIEIRFSFEENYRSVSLIKYDTDSDLAVLKLDDLNCAFKAISLGDSSKIENGNQVYAIGNLNNGGLSITKGIVSNANIQVSYDGITRKVIQCDLTIADGNSGGALLDKDGNLIGITTFRLKDNSGNVIYGISYCIPIEVISDYI